MKTRERTEPAAEGFSSYASAARPSTPGEMTKAAPADVEGAAPEQTPEARTRLKWLRVAVGLNVAIAAFSMVMGKGLDALYWASIALFFAVMAQPPERVPKLLRIFSIAALAVLGLIKVVLWILEIKGALAAGFPQTLWPDAG